MSELCGKMFFVVMITLVCLTLAGIVGVVAAKEEIVVWLWSPHVTDQYIARIEKITARFEEENPGYTLRFAFTDNWTSDKLLTAVVGGAPPDVSLISMSRARTFYELGMLQELNKYVEQTPHMGLDQFLPPTHEFIQKDGHIFGMPWSLEANAILYNREHFDEAGLDVRREYLETWDDLLRYAQSLVQQAPDGTVTRSGMILRGTGVANFTAYLYSNGGNFYNADKTAVAFNDGRGIETLEMVYRYETEYNVTRRNAGSWADLANRTTSMVFADTSSVSFIYGYDPEFLSWFDMAPIPYGPQADRTSTVSWSNMFSIPVGAKNPDLAWKFIELWLRPDSVVETFVDFGSQSVTAPRRDFFESVAFHDAVRDLPHMAVVPEIFNSSGPYPFIEYADISLIMGPLLVQAATGRIPPAAALEEAERLVNAILQR